METPNKHEYAFDVKLFAALRVKAHSEKEARELLAQALDCVTINCGAILGEPLIGEASIDEEGEFDLYEIDGEAV